MERWTLVFFQNGAAGIGGPARMHELKVKDWQHARQKAREIFRGDFEPGKKPCPHHNDDRYLTHMMLVSELHDANGDLLKKWQQEVELEEKAATEELPELLLTVCQPWVFRERGSAPDHDQHSLHVDEDERELYAREYIQKNHTSKRAPDCYSQPEGQAYLVAVDKITYLRVQQEGSVMVYDSPPKPFELRRKTA